MRPGGLAAGYRRWGWEEEEEEEEEHIGGYRRWAVVMTYWSDR